MARGTNRSIETGLNWTSRVYAGVYKHSARKHLRPLFLVWKNFVEVDMWAVCSVKGEAVLVWQPVVVYWLWIVLSRSLLVVRMIGMVFDWQDVYFF